MQQSITLTMDELKELAKQLAAELKNDSTPEKASEPKRYVYGLRGIRDLFKVSHVTAQRYKDTFLKPAIMQRGRKIIVDADKAIQLYNAYVSA